MPQPTPYARTFSFTEHEAASPSQPPPGPALDAEFNALVETLKGALGNLAKLQRDDGALKNAIVTLDALSPAAIATLGAGSNWTPRGPWETATAYAVSDVVSHGTATYVCAAAHGSDDFEAALAAGRWLLLFDDGGTEPADGSVTAAKLAAAAVQAEHIGFTGLDLAGAIRGQGGIAAGTAPPGSLFHAKAAAGDVHAKVERTTANQGAVGYQIIGVNATWALEQASNSASLRLRQGATVRVTFLSTGGMDVPGAIRAIAGDAPASGAGAFLRYAANIGYVDSYDFTANQWQDLRLRGKDVYIVAGGVVVAKVTADGIDALKPLTQNGSALGYLGIPQNQQDAAYTIAAADVGKSIYSENVAGQTITVPQLPADSSVVVINDGASSITLAQGSGVTLRLAGTATTGNRTIGAGGMAFLKWVKTGRVFVSGPGVS